MEGELNSHRVGNNAKPHILLQVEKKGDEAKKKKGGERRMKRRERNNR